MKTLIATATAGLIAAGSLAATSAPAAASGSFYLSGPNFSFGFRAPPQRYKHYRAQKVCKPVFKKVRVRWHGHPKFKRVKVGVRCHWVRPHQVRRHHHRGPRIRFSW